MSFTGFSRTDYAFNSGQYTADGGITAQDPGLILAPTEIGGELQVIRELNGDLWILTNCDLNKTTQLFTQSDSAKNSYGLQLVGQVSGAVNRVGKNAGAIPWNPISGWDSVIPIGGGGGGGTLQGLTDIDQTTQNPGYVLSDTTSGSFPFSWVAPGGGFVPADNITPGVFLSGGPYEFPTAVTFDTSIYAAPAAGITLGDTNTFPTIRWAYTNPNGAIVAKLGSIAVYPAGAQNSHVFINQNGGSSWLPILEGNIPASLVTTGTFPAGDYTFTNNVIVDGNISTQQAIILGSPTSATTPFIAPYGAGDPTGVASGVAGSILIRTDGGAAAGSRVYINQDGATGWLAIAGV